MDRALLVGIDAYPFPNALNGCLNDIQDVRAELVNALEFPPAGTVLLTDASATAGAIKAALEEAARSLGSGDRFLFWFSGHGAQVAEGDATTEVLCPVDFDFTGDASVSVGDLRRVFGGIPSGAAVVWGSDTCHSGDLEKGFHGYGVPRQFRRDPAGIRAFPPGEAPRRMKEIPAALPNVALVSGCRCDQTSTEAFIDGRCNGAMTHYFLQALRSPGGLALPLATLVLSTQMALKAAGYGQIPQLSGPPSEIARPFCHVA